jgi:hypothetical protein
MFLFYNIYIILNIILSILVLLKDNNQLVILCKLYLFMSFANINLLLLTIVEKQINILC